MDANTKAARRLAPGTKITLHTQFARHLAGERVYPVGLEISPSGICQASCGFCWFANTGELGHHRNVMLDTHRLAEVLTEASALGVKAITWTGGGEPSLHPDIKKLVDLVRHLGMRQGMFTNALSRPKYDAARLDWVRVTMTDRPWQEEHIKALRPAANVSIAFNYAGPRDNAYLTETLAVAGRCGVDYVQLRPALAFHGATVEITPPAVSHPLLHVTDYKFEEARKKHGYDRCEGYHFVPFLWEDGNLDVCAYMRKHDGYRLGNVYKQTLREIIDAAPPSVPVHKKCQICCKLHEINKSVHAARGVEDRDFP